MKIPHFSDTHDAYHWLRDFPEADVVVHSGDFRMAGNEQEANPIGHIHLQHGIIEQYDIIFSNGAIMNDNHTNLNTPDIIKI